MTVEHLGLLIKKQRKLAGMNQAELAMVSGTATRFISDLENGKESCQVGKVMAVCQNLGLELVPVTKNGEVLRDGKDT